MVNQRVYWKFYAMSETNVIFIYFVLNNLFKYALWNTIIIRSNILKKTKENYKVIMDQFVCLIISAMVNYNNNILWLIYNYRHKIARLCLPSINNEIALFEVFYFALYFWYLYRCSIINLRDPTKDKALGSFILSCYAMCLVA